MPHNTISHSQNGEMGYHSKEDIGVPENPDCTFLHTGKISVGLVDVVVLMVVAVVVGRSVLIAGLRDDDFFNEFYPSSYIFVGGENI